ncbi:MAG: hypothetical protein CMJ67_02545 [Planctomycetaceae bacterium]|nr:hypothetical protein [Planctomycetaceae bacterium]
MTWRHTIIVWIVAVILATIAGMMWRGVADADQGSISRRVHDIAIPVDDVDRVVVSRSADLGDEVVELAFERNAAGWRQVEPFEVVADGFQIRKLILAAADLVATRRSPLADLAEVGGLERIGLDSVSDRVAIEWPGGGTVVELGTRTVAGRAWIRIADSDEVMVVNDALHDQAIDDDPRNWRSRRLFPSENEITAIEIMNGEATTRLKRNGRRWEMSSPIETRADSMAVDRLIGVFGRVDHDGFVSDLIEDPADYGLMPPAATIELVRDDDARERILIGGPAGIVGRGRFAMIDGVPTVFRLDEATLAGMIPAIGSLIEPTGTAISPADVKFMVIESESGRLRLERDLDRWTISVDEEAAEEIEPATVQALLDLLSETRSTDLQVQAFPASLEVATIVLHGFDGRPLDAIRIAREPDEGRWALENGDGVLRLFPASTKIPLLR